MKHGYTLIEMLVVIAILATLMAFTAKFLHSANKRCVRMTRLTTTNHQRRLLKRVWRSFIQGCGKNTIKLNKNGTLTSNGRKAEIKDAKLILNKNGVIRKYDIPASFNAKITVATIDRGDTSSSPPENDSAKFAAIEFTPKRKNSLLNDKIVRIVAARRGG